MPKPGPKAVADVIIEVPSDQVVLVRRKNPPPGWAIPGGFIEAGESAEQGAVREALEETGLVVELTELFHVYSDPRRDPRHHTLGVVYLGRAEGEPVAGDDAADARTFSESTLPTDIAFDHRQILADYFRYRRIGTRPPPRLGAERLLSDGERAYLLRVARETIRAALAKESPMLQATPTGPLHYPVGAFVTLHRDRELRGCIGSFAVDRPLHQVVCDMALAAAFDDPRFPPVTSAEIDAVVIEISVLSELRPAAPATIVPGLHGVSISVGNQKGVFLPQVAREAGWDRETLLGETCRKAGLAPDDWKTPAAEISVFTAETFAEQR